MSYLHCHACDFSQDDFWDKDYNPITFLEKNYTKELLTKDLDKIVGFDRNTLKEIGYDKPITYREMYAWELERHGQRIREMVYRTFEEYKEKNPNRICPKCGKKELDID